MNYGRVFNSFQELFNSDDDDDYFEFNIEPQEDPTNDIWELYRRVQQGLEKPDKPSKDKKDKGGAL